MDDELLTVAQMAAMLGASYKAGVSWVGRMRIEPDGVVTARWSPDRRITSRSGYRREKFLQICRAISQPSPGRAMALTNAARSFIGLPELTHRISVATGHRCSTCRQPDHNARTCGRPTMRRRRTP